MSMFKTVEDFNFKGKRVLVRCDFNVPIDKEGNILDDFRIKEAVPTIEYLIKKRAKVILMSHLGRPEGKVVENLKLDKVQERLMEYLDFSITKAPDYVGPEIEKYTRQMDLGEILLLENLRFHKGETDNSEEFAQKLAELGDIYINDAFSVCHRNHASIVGVPRFLLHGAGLLLEKEIRNFNKILKNPARPMVVLIGGAKIKTKVDFIEKFSNLADFVLIGSLLEKEIVEQHLKLKYPQKIMDPFAELTAKDLDEKTIEKFSEIILKAKTIFWNGPFGKIEEEKYKKGTLKIANAIIESGAFSVAGGGETVEFLNKENLALKFSHVSTGGGAMLAYLSGEILPGLEALG